MFWNGSTAIDGLSGSGKRGGGAAVGGRRISVARHSVNPDRAGDVLEAVLADVVEGEGRACRDVLLHHRETQMPPGSARASSRAATLTPSPKMSSSSTTMSP